MPLLYRPRYTRRQNMMVTIPGPLLDDRPDQRELILNDVVEVPFKYARELLDGKWGPDWALGYALTVHSSQGLTIADPQKVWIIDDYLTGWRPSDGRTDPGLGVSGGRRPTVGSRSNSSRALGTHCLPSGASQCQVTLRTRCRDACRHWHRKRSRTRNGICPQEGRRATPRESVSSYSRRESDTGLQGWGL